MADPSMQAKFLASNGEKPTKASRDKSQSRKNQRRGKPLKRKKMFQEIPPERRGYWHGVMCLKLRQQEDEEGFDGFYRCECGDPECDASIEGFDEARRFFVPGHIKPRAEFNHRGFRFPYVATLGPDEPANIVPVTKDCNAREFWNRKEAS